jgi:hypothetical protein
VHANFMRFYKDKSLNVTEELEQAAEHNEHQRFVVSTLLDLRYNDEEMRYEVQVAWRGFPVADADWQPYDVMAVDVPEMMSKFLGVYNDKEMVAQVRSLLELAHHGEVLWFDAGQPLVTSTPTAVNPLLTRGIQNSYHATIHVASLPRILAAGPLLFNLG